MEGVEDSPKIARLIWFATASLVSIVIYFVIGLISGTLYASNPSTLCISFKYVARSLASERAFAKAYSFCARVSKSSCCSGQSGVFSGSSKAGDVTIESGDTGLGGYSSGMVRHASLTARMRRLRRRCTGSVEVEEMYSRWLISGRGVESAKMVAPACLARTVGKCLFKRAMASSTRPDRIWVCISMQRGIVNLVLSTGRGLTLPKLVLHQEVV